MHAFMQAMQKKTDIVVPVDAAARESERQTAMVEQALSEARKKRLLEAASASSSTQPNQENAFQAAEGVAADEEAKIARLSAFVGSMSESQKVARNTTRPPPSTS